MRHQRRSTDGSHPGETILAATGLEQLNAIGAALSAERDINRLLETILIAAKTITNADGGTLYRVDRGQAAACASRSCAPTRSNIAMGGTTGNPIPFYPIRRCTTTAASRTTPWWRPTPRCTGQTVNIADAYTAEGFDFSGTRKFDKKTGYRSQSFLTVPMKNHENEIIGVLQLINCQRSGDRRDRAVLARPTSGWPSRSPRRRPSR